MPKQIDNAKPKLAIEQSYYPIIKTIMLLKTAINISNYMSQLVSLLRAKISNLNSLRARILTAISSIVVVALVWIAIAPAYSNTTAINVGFNFPKVIADPNPPIILGAGGETFTFIKTGKTTCGKYTIAEAVVPPGEGPPPHIHHYTNEWFYFPDGGITIMHGSTTYPGMQDIPGVTMPKAVFHLEKTKPGSIYYGSRYNVHGFINHSKTPKRLTFVWTPDDDKVGIYAYLKAVGQPVLDISNPPSVNPKNRELFVTQAPQYGINQSRHFWEYIDSVDYNFPKMSDLHLDELQALLAPDVEGGKPTQCKGV